MVCLRTFRRHWICSTFVFSLFLFFSVFGLSQNSYATSFSCELTPFYGSGWAGNQYLGGSMSPACNGFYSSVDRSLTRYLSYEFTFNYVNTQSAYFRLTTDMSSDDIVLGFFNINQTGLISYSGTIVLPPNFSPDYLRYNLYSSRMYMTYGKLTLSDEPPSSGEPEPCPVCPEIPENPYDNKFDALTKAIYCCGAILIMLYFFFCIYKIIVKDGGSR